MQIQLTLFGASKPLPYRVTPNGIELFVKVTPRSSRNRTDGTTEGADGKIYLKIYVTAQPADNEANEAVMDVLAKTFKIPKSTIALKSGGTLRYKMFLIDQVDTKMIERIC